MNCYKDDDKSQLLVSKISSGIFLDSRIAARENYKIKVSFFFTKILSLKINTGVLLFFTRNYIRS